MDAAIHDSSVHAIGVGAVIISSGTALAPESIDGAEERALFLKRIDRFTRSAF